MRRQITFLFSLYFLLGFNLSSYCQLELLSDIDIPCDKVFAVQGDIALGADHEVHFRDVKTFDLNTGITLSENDKIIRKSIEIGERVYLLLDESLPEQSSTVHVFMEGQLLQLDYPKPVIDLLAIQNSELLLGITDDGFIVLDNGVIIREVVLGASILDLVPYQEGYLGISNSSYFFFDEGLELQTGNSLPEGLSSFGGACKGNSLLLKGTVADDLRHELYVYDLVNGSTLNVIDSSGNQVFLHSFSIPQNYSGNEFFLSGCGQVMLGLAHFSVVTESGFVDPASGIYTDFSFRPDIMQNVVRPVTKQTPNGTMVFGRMGIEGVELYAVSEQGISVIEDIYPGYGGGVDLLIPNTANMIGGQHFTPQAFELIESGENVYFAARSPHLGLQIWKSDGTSESTFPITKENIVFKGYRKCFLSSNHGNVLASLHLKNGRKKLYKIEPDAQEVNISINQDENWEVVYARSPSVTSFTRYGSLTHPKVNLAQDGSSMLFLEKSDL